VVSSKVFGRKTSYPMGVTFKHFPGGTEENYENLSQDSWCLGRVKTEDLLNANLWRYGYIELAR
jgi:hypothetical protein